MINLKDETLTAIVESGHKQSDVLQVRDSDTACTIERFLELADAEYDEGYGCSYVKWSLQVLFKDGSWLEREEYDGKEWWNYRQTPTPLPEDSEELDTAFI